MRGGISKGIALPVGEIGSLYPLSVQQRGDKWGVFSAVTGGFLGELKDSYEEAYQDAVRRKNQKV